VKLLHGKKLFYQPMLPSTKKIVLYIYFILSVEPDFDHEKIKKYTTRRFIDISPFKCT